MKALFVGALIALAVAMSSTPPVKAAPTPVPPTQDSGYHIAT